MPYIPMTRAGEGSLPAMIVDAAGAPDESPARGLPGRWLRRAGKVALLLLACQLVLAPAAARAQALTLEQCVKLALKNNPDLQGQRMNLNLARGDLSEQKSRNFGKLDMVSSYTRYNLPRTLAPMTPASIMKNPASVSTTEDLFTAGLVYEVALFTGFAQTRSVEIAALQKETAGARLKLSREQLIYNVKTLYVNILSQQSQGKAQDSYLKALQRLHDDIAYELKLGKKARLDLLKAAADLEKAKAQKYLIVSNIKNMKAALASLLDVERIAELEDIDPTRRPMQFIDDDFAGSIKQLQRLKAAQLEIEKSELQVDRANGGFYPQVMFSMAYGRNFGPNDDSNLDSGEWREQEVWQAGLQLKWNIFDFGAQRAKVRKARARARQSRFQRRKTELELRRSLREAVTKINTAITEFKSAKAELAMTRETEAIEQVRFKQGAADINDLLYAKARNQLALSRFINAGYSFMVSRFYLDYLLESGEDR